MHPEGYSRLNRKRPPKPKKERVKVRKRVKGDEEGFGRRRFQRSTLRVVWSWFILITLAAVLSIWGYRTIWKQYMGSLEEPVPPLAKPSVPELPPALEGPIRWNGPAPDDVARSFLEARTEEERLGLVRHPKAVRDLMRHFYTKGPGREEKPVSLNPMDEVFSGEKIVRRYAMTMEDGSTRLVSIPFTEDGKALVDFKVYSRYCSHPWSEVLAGKVPSAPEMRVFLSGGAYYNHGFADESRWMSFVASSPDLDGPIYLYADRTGPDVSEDLKQWSADSGTPPVRCVVALESLGDGHLKRQFVLKKLIRVGWLDP